MAGEGDVLQQKPFLYVVLGCDCVLISVKLRGGRQHMKFEVEARGNKTWLSCCIRVYEAWTVSFSLPAYGTCASDDFMCLLLFFLCLRKRSGAMKCIVCATWKNSVVKVNPIRS